MSTKLLERAEVKATVTTDKQNVLEFYACAFSSVPDKNGDIIDPGALDEWLADFYKGGFPLPVSFTHAAVRQSMDPFAIIGYAPADAQHVFKDEHGLRIRAYLDTGSNETAQQVYTLTKRGIVTGASIAYEVATGGERMMDSGPNKGSMLITKMRILEAGPCLEPANDEAFVISVKAMMQEADLKALDDSAWDANRAMGMCSSAAEYRSICAGEHAVGEPDQRQHWALPHHYPGRDANAAGVAAARGRFDQTEGLVNKSAARTHLFETHSLPSDSEKSASLVTVTGPDVILTDVSTTAPGLAAYVTTLSPEPGLKVGRTLSSKTAAELRKARSILDGLLSLVEDELSSVEAETKASTAELRVPELARSPNADITEELAAILRS